MTLPKEADLAAFVHVLGASIIEIPMPLFRRDDLLKISDGDDRDDEHFLIEVLGLTLPIEEPYWRTIKAIVDRQAGISVIPKIWKTLSPLVLRFLARFSFQFEQLMSNEDNPPIYEDGIVQDLLYVIPLIYQIPSPNLTLAQTCSKTIFTRIFSILRSPIAFSHNPALKSLLDSVFAACHSLLTPHTSITSIHELPVGVAIEYCRSISLYFKESLSSALPLHIILQAMQLAMRIEPQFLISHKATFVGTLMDASIAIFEVIACSDIPPDQHHKLCMIGSFLVELFTFFYSVLPGFSLSQYPKSEFLAHFILWYLKVYPLTLSLISLIAQRGQP
jgi:hypothetical protein